MNACTTVRRHCALLLAVSVLTLHGSGLHVPLSQDGQEPPTALPFEDSGIHADHGAEQHQDVEHPLDNGLIKTLKSGLDSPALVNTAGFVFGMVFDAVAGPRAERRPAPAHSVRFLRPPLRAPPL